MKRRHGEREEKEKKREERVDETVKEKRKRHDILGRNRHILETLEKTSENQHSQSHLEGEREEKPATSRFNRI